MTCPRCGATGTVNGACVACGSPAKIINAAPMVTAALLSYGDILAAAFQLWGVPLATLRGKQRSGPISTVRAAIAIALYDDAGMLLAQIGEILAKDHASISYALSKRDRPPLPRMVNELGIAAHKLRLARQRTESVAPPP